MPSIPRISTVADGQPGSLEYRLRFRDDTGRCISPWHDVPLETGENGVFNAIIEIPKMTRAKMEVATKEAGNSIAQDVKKGKLRDYHGPIYWNYGMLPQTWENPYKQDAETKASGDNDPLDVVEIGSTALPLGTIEPVKPLGVLAMIDDGELDWKIIAVSTRDPLAKLLNDVNDVDTHCPGVISGIREWFRWYKSPDGKPLNCFGFDEAALSREKAIEVIAETHDAWQELRAGHIDNPELWVPNSWQQEGEFQDDGFESRSPNTAIALQPVAVASSYNVGRIRSKL